MADLPKGAKVYNVIRQSMNEVYMNTLPVATADNITQISNLLFNDRYQPGLNDFVTNLINRIGLTKIENMSYNNPLSVFKKGSTPLGTDIQLLYENPANAEPYQFTNTEMAKLLSITDPDTHTAYLRRNRQDLYTKSISRAELQGAFVSWDKFEEYITGITNSLYSGNYIDEFEYTKALVDGAYESNKVIVEVVPQVIDESTGKQFVKKARALFTKMQFPSTKYNAYTRFSGAKGEIKTWTTSDRVVLITTADVMAEIDVDVLAVAFNMNKADFMGRVVIVDQFDNPSIQAVICDESWLQIYDNLFRFDEFYNARVMAWNEYLHVWGTFAISPFANAVVLATQQPTVKATSVSFGTQKVNLGLSNIPNYEILEMQVEPSNTSDEITYTTGGTTGLVRVEKVDRLHVKVTPLKVGTGATVTATINGKTSTLNVDVEA